MLIVPLHRPLTRANFPFITALLILVNVLVYFGWQTRDARVLEGAAQYYEQAGIARYEAPAYERWLAERGQALPDLDEESGAMPPIHQLISAIQNDQEFLAELRADRVITPEQGEFAVWRPLREEFDRRWNSTFTERHMMLFSEWSPVRAFTAMFLHGDAGHLFGNMVFLAFLGLLVEGALGGGRFLLLYLLGGLGGQLVSLAWRWGETGGGLGASGAIAGLMGAYCVLWGMRKVRVFYWFFVVFDYVRVPALALLPLWLGWEVLNLTLTQDSRVAFDVHAGGIVSGALLGLAAVRLGWRREAFLQDEPVRDDGEADFHRAMLHLGKLETGPARELLRPLIKRAAPPLPRLLAWYRCCRYQPGRPELADAAARVLRHRDGGASERQQMRETLGDWLGLESRLPIPESELLDLARRWLDIGALDDAESLLQTLHDEDSASPALADAWLQLVRDALQGKDRARAERAAQNLSLRFPGSAQTGKAEFLRQAG
ncbi:rhomboid family intramembrane serine protease [Arenimonas sp.]|uniref:rhomboid family intramembrane serine protease n=1 Tax=Arenimonas sp. TaxID=1872635 RepID=UPI0039E46615